MTEREEELSKVLQPLEMQLMQAKVRKDRVEVSSLLHDEFVEFGASGNMWSREGILDLLEKEASYEASEVRDFEAHMFAQDCALVTYQVSGKSGDTLRSSVWLRSAAGWKIRFHQGTKVLPG